MLFDIEINALDNRRVCKVRRIHNIDYNFYTFKEDKVM